MGIPAIAPTTRHDQMGVWRFGLTFARGFEKGSWLSRAIPKHSRMVEVMMAMQQTKIAAETTPRYVVAKAFEKFDSMMPGSTP